MTDSTESDSRVLILAPTRRDSEVTVRLLSGVGLNCIVCPDPEALATEIARGGGAVLLTDHITNSRSADAVVNALRNQPPWSDLPIVMLVVAAAPAQDVKRFLGLLSNVTVLERPATSAIVISTIQAALRAR